MTRSNLCILVFVIIISQSTTHSCENLGRITLEGINWFNSLEIYIDEEINEFIIHLDNWNTTGLEIKKTFDGGLSESIYVHASSDMDLNSLLQKNPAIISATYVLIDKYGFTRFVIPDQLLISLDPAYFDSIQDFINDQQLDIIWISYNTNLMTIWVDDIYMMAAKLRRIEGITVEPIFVQFDVLEY